MLRNPTCTSSTHHKAVSEPHPSLAMKHEAFLAHENCVQVFQKVMKQLYMIKDIQQTLEQLIKNQYKNILSQLTHSLDARSLS
jgi:hypothetical protein